MIASKYRHAARFFLSPRNTRDAPEGRNLLSKMGSSMPKIPWLMDRAYEGDKNREQAVAMGLNPVMPPKKSHLNPWKHDKEMYKKRNQVERLSPSLLSIR